MPQDTPAAGRPLRVVLTMHPAVGNYEQLSPGGRAEWGRCRFLFNPPPGTEADFWIVVHNGRPRDHMRVAPENTLFMAGEPLEKRLYGAGFYRQFQWVLDTHRQSGHPRVNIGALPMGWHVGLDMYEYRYQFGYDFLTALPCPEKQNRISVICSDARDTPGQRARLDFLAEVKRQLGDQVVHYGRGFEPLPDKLTGILPHRFHLALENCQVPHYWTEKLADAYLGWALPLYVGCTNLQEYIDPNWFVRIDPSHVDQSIRTMRCLFDSSPIDAERAAVALGRDAILNRYNPFAIFAHWVETHWQPLSPQRVEILGHKAFRNLLRGAWYRWRNRRCA